MKAVENDSAEDAVGELTQSVASAGHSFAEWPEEAQESWLTCFELLAESVSPEAMADLLFHLARVGYDSQAFRDALARHFRQRFSDYADPAGLIQSLGVHDAAVSMPQLYKRWLRMQALEEGQPIFHPAHGAGKVSEVDDLGNEVRIRFTRPTTFALQTVLDTCTLLNPESFLAKVLIRGDERPLAEVAKEVMAEMPNALVPPADDRQILRAFLVPDCCSSDEFDEIFNMSLKTVKTSKTGQAAAAEPGATRDLGKSRSLDELLTALRETDELDDDDRARETIARLLRDAAPKENVADNFAEAVARLWMVAESPEWLINLLAEMASEATPWGDRDRMAAVTNPMKAVMGSEWLHASAEALPPEHYARICMQLPLRYLTVAETHYSKVFGDLSGWDQSMRRQMKTNAATADQLVNIWKRDGRDAAELRDPGLILRTLGKPVHGPYIQAQKTLHRLLMQDEKFQDFLTNDGDVEVAPGFIGAVKHSATLESGERQSLLVKLVRRHPHLKPYVEQKSAPRRKKMAAVTSERSFQLRQAELHSIIREKIPANSKAIAHARSYGDLKENAEYKAAKEEQAYLSARRNELEDSLDKVRPVNFREVEDPDRVVPGVAVDLQGADGRTDTFYVLGMWDSDPDLHIISYETPLGHALLGKTEGADITMPTGDEKTITRITRLPEEILQWQDSDT